jgi:uroporphyrin-III C-methyltransferase/precorrin-2 dehydrogenase/sirohydrochlorin ferrochelatase
MSNADLSGPAITFYGLAPRDAAAQSLTLKEFA